MNLSEKWGTGMGSPEDSNLRRTRLSRSPSSQLSPQIVIFDIFFPPDRATNLDQISVPKPQMGQTGQGYSYLRNSVHMGPKLAVVYNSQALLFDLLGSTPAIY